MLTVPLVFLFGTGLFFQLLDQMSFRIRELRYLLIGVFGFVACLPMVYVFLPPKTSPLAYPPYYPPAIQQTCGWMKENELMMSDIPWAMAWYGNRQCVWLTQNAQSEFFAIHDFLKPVRGLYLTPANHGQPVPLAMGAMRATTAGRASFSKACCAITSRKTFPCATRPRGFFPEQLFLTDYDRWSTTIDGKPASSGPIAPPVDRRTEAPKDQDAAKK